MLHPPLLARHWTRACLHLGRLARPGLEGAISGRPYSCFSLRLTRPLAHHTAKVEALLEIHLGGSPSGEIPQRRMRGIGVAARSGGFKLFAAMALYAQMLGAKEEKKALETTDMECEASNTPNITRAHTDIRLRLTAKSVANAHDVNRRVQRVATSI
jgi:hypothetical protein